MSGHHSTGSGGSAAKNYLLVTDYSAVIDRKISTDGESIPKNVSDSEDSPNGAAHMMDELKSNGSDNGLYTAHEGNESIANSYAQKEKAINPLPTLENSEQYDRNDNFVTPVENTSYYSDVGISTENYAEIGQDFASIGAYLKANREAHGIDITGLSEHLRIRPRYIEAIETGQYEDLPGVAYAVGFVRTYANLLGLDGEAVSCAYKESFSGKNNSQQTIISSVRWWHSHTETASLRRRWVALSLGVVTGAYGLWWYTAGLNDPEIAVDPVPHHLAQRVDSIDTDLSVPKQTIPKQISSGQASLGSNESAVDGGSVSDDSQWEHVPSSSITVPELAFVQEKMLTGTEPVSAPIKGASLDGSSLDSAFSVATNRSNIMRGRISLSPESAQASVTDMAPSRIILHAIAETWVQIRDSEQRSVFTAIMQAGGEYEVPDKVGLTLKTGNAGGVQFLVDNILVQPIGPSGTVRSGIKLEPELLLVGKAYTPPLRQRGTDAALSILERSEAEISPLDANGPDANEPGAN